MLEPATIKQTLKFVNSEIRINLLSEMIHSKMLNGFSRLTLAKLDKAYALKGDADKLQINEISKMAIYEVLGRETNHVLDQELLSKAWSQVYQKGMCPTNHSVAH